MTTTAPDPRPAADPPRLLIVAGGEAGRGRLAAALAGAPGAEVVGAATEQAGGITLAESESSAVVYGMPRRAAETGLVDEVLPLDAMVARLRRFAEEGR